MKKNPAPLLFALIIFMIGIIALFVSAPYGEYILAVCPFLALAVLYFSIK